MRTQSKGQIFDTPGPFESTFSSECDFTFKVSMDYGEKDIYLIDRLICIVLC